MMISRTFIIYGIFLKCVTAVTGTGLVNDTCGTVSIRDDISNRTAKVTCIDDARVFDPKSQNGSYLLNNTGNWAGEMFACLCSCRVPLDLKNGHILSKNKIPHGQTLNYSCDEGYEKNIDKRIVCNDGLLMTIPGYLETQDIYISTREKSLPDWFVNKFEGKVFDLRVNQSANWSIPDTELQMNQKVFQILSVNETILRYYLCKGKSCMLGYVCLGMGGLDCISLESRDLECKQKLSGTTTAVSSNQDLPQLYILVKAVVLVSYLSSYL